MIAAMPKGVRLDGEIHGGIGTFQATVGRIRRGDWHGLRYAIFDVINEELFEARQATLKALLSPSLVRCPDAHPLRLRSSPGRLRGRYHRQGRRGCDTTQAAVTLSTQALW